jgi:sensor histidine kinase YesM
MRGLTNLLWASQFMLVWWVITYVFPYTTDDLRLRRLEVDRLRRTAELARLRSNLEPHFLLNTLNAIAGLVSEDPKEARRLIVALGDLLGDSLDDRDTETLGEQLGWLRKYASILETRHGERLHISWDVAEDARHIVVPRFLLQPLLENAVNHGALCCQDSGEVHVRATVVDDATVPTLICEVQDNGPGLPRDAPRNGAKGIALVQSRLQAMDARARFRLEPGYPGTRAILEIPVHEGIPSKGSVR